jgi:hypothetical protein
VCETCGSRAHRSIVVCGLHYYHSDVIMIIRDCITVTSYGNDSSAVLVYNGDGEC